MFEGFPKSYLPQTLVSPSRNVQKMKTDCDSHSSTSNRKSLKMLLKVEAILSNFVRIFSLM